MNKHTVVRRIALMAAGAVLGGLGAHVYRRTRRTLRPYDRYRNRLPHDKAAWLPYHHRWDAREQLWADLWVEVLGGVNSALTRITLGLYQPESLAPQSGHVPAAGPDTVPPSGSAPTHLRVPSPVGSDS